MISRSALVHTVGELRRSYTGEIDDTLWPTVTAGVEKVITPQDRVTLRESLGSSFETRLLGENSHPPVDDRIRRVVIADTTDPVQQELEAGILFALGSVGPYLMPATTMVAPAPVCTWVRPTLDRTQTILNQRAEAAPMIAALLPHVVDGTVHGLAGLRARSYRRNVTLYLADGVTGSVSLAHMSPQRWRAVLGFARVIIGHERLLLSEGPLTEVECAAIAAGRVPGPAWMASALLRRLRILGDTMWLTIQPDGRAGIRVRWSGGRTAGRVATALVHPLAGLPGDRFIVARAAGGAITIASPDADGVDTATIVLDRAPLDTPPPFARIDATAAWAELGREVSQPIVDRASE